ncbi:MAG: nuclear transport factor 2 family protein [Rubrivirga sp.]
MLPTEAAEAWVAAFAAGRLASLYAADAVNHQVAELPVKGRPAIRAMFEREFAGAQMTCVVENLFKDGKWAILEWCDPLGLQGSGFFHVVNGQIAFQRGYWGTISVPASARVASLPVVMSPDNAASTGVAGRSATRTPAATRFHD